jgi:hypothetical protein
MNLRFPESRVSILSQLSKIRCERLVDDKQGGETSPNGLTDSAKHRIVPLKIVDAVNEFLPRTKVEIAEALLALPFSVNPWSIENECLDRELRTQKDANKIKSSTQKTQSLLQGHSLSHNRLLTRNFSDTQIGSRRSRLKVAWRVVG